MAQYDQVAVNENEDALEFRKSYGVVPMLCNYPDPTVEQGYVWDTYTDTGLLVNDIVGSWVGGARIVDDTDYLGRTKRAIQIADFTRTPPVGSLTGFYIRDPVTEVKDGNWAWTVFQGSCAFEIQGYWPNRGSETEYKIWPYFEPPRNPTFQFHREMWISQDRKRRTVFHVYHEKGYPTSPWYSDAWVAFRRGEWGYIRITRQRDKVHFDFDNVDEFGGSFSGIENWREGWDFMEINAYPPEPGWRFWVQPYFDSDYGGDWLKIKNITIVNDDFIGKIARPLPREGS